MTTRHHLARTIADMIRDIRSDSASLIARDSTDDNADAASLYARTLVQLHDPAAGLGSDYDLRRGQQEHTAQLLLGALTAWHDTTDLQLGGTELRSRVDHLAHLTRTGWQISPATVTTVDTVQPLSLFGSTDGALFDPNA